MEISQNVQWQVFGRKFELLIESGFGELNFPEGQTITLQIEEWQMLAAVLCNCLKVEKLRSVISGQENAGRPWSIESDAELQNRWKNGEKIKDLATHFQRSDGAIRSRLSRLGLVKLP